MAQVEAVLQDAGLAEPRADAGILVEDATGLGRAALLFHPDAALDEAAAAKLQASVARRLGREPVFRILGRREFWGLDLRIGPEVLDPRPDTETIVRAAVEVLRTRAEPLRILDLGTGSGAILCALLAEFPAASGVGIDRSAEACATARHNLHALGFASRAVVAEGDWAEGVTGRFDLVVSNPPYIESAMIADLAPEVRDHDPALALDGGADGLDAYRHILPSLPRLLAPDGLAVLEVGAGQAPAVQALLLVHGCAVAGTRRDLGGHERAVLGRLDPGGRGGPEERT